MASMATFSNTDAASESAILSLFLEIISPLATELSMFALAVIVYTLFSGESVMPLQKLMKLLPRTREAPTRKLSPSYEEACRKAAAHSAAGVKTACSATTEESKTPTVQSKADGSDNYQPVLQATRSGDVTAMLDVIGSLPAKTASEMPTQVIAKVMLALAKTSKLSEENMWKLMDLSTGKNIPIDQQAFETAAAEAARWRSAAACRKLYDIAGILSIPRSDKALSYLMRGHAKDTAAMLAFAEDMTSEGSGITLTKGLSNSLIAQCTAGIHDSIVALIKERTISPTRALMDTGRQTRIIRDAGKDGRLQDAIGALKKIKDDGLVNCYVYNTFLNACIDCDHLEHAAAAFEEMKGSVQPDSVTYNTMIKGYASKGNLKAARHLLHEMSQHSIPQNSHSYNPLLQELLKRGDQKAAWLLVDEMRSMPSVGTNSVTYCILIKAIQHKSQSKEFSRLLALLDAECDCIDEHLVTVVAETCMRLGRPDALTERMAAFQEKGFSCKVSAPVYGSIIKASGQKGDLQQVWAAWEEMKVKRVKCSSVTLGCMVEALVSNSQTDAAWTLVNDIWHNPEERDLVNTVIYSTVVKGFVMSKQHEKVLLICKEMKERGVYCNLITYNTMLNSVARSGAMEHVDEILADMRSAEPPATPDIVTYSTIIKGYCTAGDLEKALKVVEDMKAAGLKPDEVTYNSLLDGCAKMQKLDKALSILEEMRSSGVAPSNFTLSIIIKLVGRVGKLDMAFQLAKTLPEEYGFTANIQVQTCLMQACFLSRQCNRALALHDTIVKEGVCMPDEKTYTAIVRGCLSNGMKGKAVEAVRCAYHLPQDSMEVTRGAPAGVDRRCLEELIAKVGYGSADIKALLVDLKKHCGVVLSESKCSTGTYRARGQVQRN